MEFNPFPIDDYIPEEVVFAEAVKRLCLNRLGGPSGMWADHFRQWIWEAMWEKYPNDTNWIKVVTLVQALFQEGSLVDTCVLQTGVLITKWYGKDLRGIGLF